jgi:hypothetical protein
MSVRIHRVVVRGQFADLTADQRAALLAEANDHSIFRAAYTASGTFTYEPNLVAFQLRYEVRTSDDDPDPRDPVDVGLDLARTQLDEWGIAVKHVRATATDMSAMWSG